MSYLRIIWSVLTRKKNILLIVFLIVSVILGNLVIAKVPQKWSFMLQILIVSAQLFACFSIGKDIMTECEIEERRTSAAPSGHQTHKKKKKK